MSELTLKIGNYFFNKFNKFELGLNFNSVASVFSFDGFFDINNPDHKKLFKPLTYPSCEVLFDNKKIITGTILNYSSAIAGESSLTGISGYSKTGVLEDCEVSLDSYPLESNNLTLKEIAEKYCKPFGITVKVIDDHEIMTSGEAFLEGFFGVEKKYTSVSAEPNETVKNYLAKLAKERGIILTHDADGNLVFIRKGTQQKSIATYTENKPSTKISLSINGQNIHSRISAQGQVSIGTDVSGMDTIKNLLLPTSVYRPTVKEQETGDNDDTISHAKLIRASELRNIQLTIETPEWYWFDGKQNHIILPNNIIDVISPSNYLSKKSQWFVESVDLSGDETKSIAIIKAVLPEVYTFEEPQYIFS
jgi:prophage tail gpP-like protein